MRLVRASIGSLLAAAAIGAVHVAARLRHVHVFLETELARPLLDSADAFYHAHRTELLYEAFPVFRYQDPFMFHPEGAVAEWPLGLDWMVAGALRGLGLVGVDWASAVWLVPFVQLVLSVATLAVFLKLAHAHLPAAAAWGASLAFALSTAIVRVSAAGGYDHHVNEVTGVVLLLLLPHLAGARGSRAGSVAAGIALGLLTWTTTLLAFVIAAFLLVSLVVGLFERPELEPQRHLRAASIALGATLALFATIESAARGAPFALTTLSYAHVLAVAVPLGAMELLGRTRPVVVIGLLTLALGGAIVAFGPPVGWAARFALGGDPFFGNVSEARPIFLSDDGPTFMYVHALYGLAYVAFPLAFLAVRRRGPAAMPAAVLWFCLVLFFIGFSQKRFAHLFAPALIFVTVAWASGVSRGRWRAAALALALITLCEPFIVYGAAVTPRISPGSRDAIAVATVLRRRAATESPLGVSAPPNMGSAINWLAGLPSVTNAFFYPQYLVEDLRLREIESSSELVDHLHARRIGYLVAADDVRYRTMLLELLDRSSEAARFVDLETRPCHPAYMQYAYDRAACLPEPIGGLERISTIELARDPGRLMRRAVIYRVERAPR